MRFTELLKLVESASAASDVVGPDDEGRAKRVKRVRAELHPDRHEGTDKVQAEHAFARLEELLGKEKRHVDAKTHASFDITTKKRAYVVNGLAFKGVVANLYNVTYMRDDEEKRGLLKVARAPRDTDLINAEAKVLKAAWSAKTPEGKPDDRIPFYPRFEEVFTYRDDASHIDRRAIVQRRLSGFVSLAEVSRHFTSGLDVRDLAWIWRRVLAGVSLAHDLGFVHGCLTAEHILIHPEVHGVQLVGWGQSVEIGDTVKLLGSDLKGNFPPEILTKKPVDQSTDIFMLSRTFQSLMHPGSVGTNTYSRFNAFVQGCTKARPKDALRVLEEYDELLERSFGKRKFRVFPNFPGRTTSETII